MAFSYNSEDILYWKYSSSFFVNISYVSSACIWCMQRRAAGITRWWLQAFDSSDRCHTVTVRDLPASYLVWEVIRMAFCHLLLHASNASILKYFPSMNFGDIWWIRRQKYWRLFFMICHWTDERILSQCLILKSDHLALLITGCSAGWLS